MTHSARNIEEAIASAKNTIHPVIRPVVRGRISDDILVQLTNLILDDVYKSGDKLLPERELAGQLGVNRASLREALRRMEVMGLVHIRQGGGIYVQNPSTHAGIEFVSFLLQTGIHLDKKLILDMAEMRILFVKEMLVLACSRIDEQLLASMENIVEEISSADLKDRQTGQLDFDFYYSLAKASGNRFFVFILNTVHQVMKSVIGVYFQVKDNPKTSIKLYRDLIDALRERDSERALEIFEKQARRDDAVLAAMLEGWE